jgi:hypothetical protein
MRRVAGRTGPIQKKRIRLNMLLICEEKEYKYGTIYG